MKFLINWVRSFARGTNNVTFFVKSFVSSCAVFPDQWKISPGRGKSRSSIDLPRTMNWSVSRTRLALFSPKYHCLLGLVRPDSIAFHGSPIVARSAANNGESESSNDATRITLPSYFALFSSRYSLYFCRNCFFIIKVFIKTIKGAVRMMNIECGYCSIGKKLPRHRSNV